MWKMEIQGEPSSIHTTDDTGSLTGNPRGGPRPSLGPQASQHDGRGPSLRQMFKDSTQRRGFFSVIATLTIGIMGSAVLPVPWAFSVTGIVAGVLIMVVVSLANVYTSDLLLRQSLKTGASTYESLAFKVGGRWWKLTTEIGIVILLLGGMLGGLQQIGEVGSIGLQSIWPEIPGWLVNGSGRTIMALATVFIIAPLCMVEHLRQLEYAGVLGTCIVLCLVGAVVYDSSRENLPAIKNHQLPTWGFSSIGDVTQAVSIFGFAFFDQPIMMPLLREMPSGKAGVKIISWGNRVVVLGDWIGFLLSGAFLKHFSVNAFLVYLFVGLFGAGRYGPDTNENILQNIWLGGGVAQGILNLSMALFLALGTPLAGFPLCITLDDWVPGDREKHKRIRKVCIMSVVLIVLLGLAEAFPDGSGQVLTATGATGVCLVSYLVPIVNHLLLFFGRARCQKPGWCAEGTGASVVEVYVDEACGNNALPVDSATTAYETALLYRKPVRQAWHARTWEVVSEVVRPVLVLSVGAFCSVAALSTIG